jgi:hypothetical protein
MELASSACVSKAAALARLLPAWLRCVAAGEVGAVWGTPRRVAAVLGCDADEAADRIGAWLAALGEPVAVQADVEEVVLRAVTRWQSSGMFLEGVQRDEITAVIGGAIASL